MFKPFIRVLQTIFILFFSLTLVFSGETVIEITSNSNSGSSSPAASNENPYAGISFISMQNDKILVYTFESNKDVIDFYSNTDLSAKYSRSIKLENVDDANSVIQAIQNENSLQDKANKFTSFLESSNPSTVFPENHPLNLIDSDANSAIEAFKSGNDHPLLSSENQKLLVENGIYPNDDGKGLLTSIENLQKTIREGTCKKDDCKDEQKLLDSQMSIFGELPTAVILQIENLNSEQIKAINKGLRQEDCEDSFIGTGWLCRLTSDKSLENLAIDDAIRSLNDIKDNFNQGKEGFRLINEMENIRWDLEECEGNECDRLQEDLEDAEDRYQKAYAKYYNSQILLKVKEYFPNSDLFAKDGFCEKELSNACLNALEDECNKPKSIDIGCKVADELYDQLIVETNLVFDILGYITSPDQDALRAAKLFGIEADYSNVPNLLREPFSSQICLAKIDGYLDATRETEVGGSAGITRYQCQNTVEQVIDYQTNTVQTAGDNNCLQVLGDIRGQRTLTTPDSKTAITYSAFIRAPLDSDIKYTLAVSYTQGGSEKVINLFEDLKNLTQGETANEFDNIFLEINQSEGDLDETSFQIGLFSFLPNGNRYVQLTTPIIVVGEGDYFKSINVHEQTNETSYNNSAYTSSTDELNWDDVEDTINFGGGGG